MTTTFETLQYDVHAGVLTLTLDRPDRLNAMTNTMLNELLAAFDAADADDAVRVMIVTGGGRAFCAGADLSESGRSFAARVNDVADGELARDRGGIIAMRMFGATKPVIGAINGAAVGIGASMTLPMDVRLASEHAKFGFVYVRRGIVLEGASSWFLPRVVGISRAIEWCMTGRLVTAGEALQAGLVRSVHPAEELLCAARALAHEVVDGTAPVSVALSRQLLWRMLGEEHPMAAHRAESRAVASRRISPDAREGVASFLEKRPAVFTDRVSDGLPDVFPDWEDPRFF